MPRVEDDVKNNSLMAHTAYIMLHDNRFVGLSAILFIPIRQHHNTIPQHHNSQDIKYRNPGWQKERQLWKGICPTAYQ